MENITTAIEDIISTAEKLRGAYFFNPPCNASSRRSYEKFFSRPTVTWVDGKDTFSASYSVSCSCRNVYASGTYTRNGQKTTLTAIRNSLARLVAAGDRERQTA